MPEEITIKKVKVLGLIPGYSYKHYKTKKTVEIKPGKQNRWVNLDNKKYKRGIGRKISFYNKLPVEKKESYKKDNFKIELFEKLPERLREYIKEKKPEAIIVVVRKIGYWKKILHLKAKYQGRSRKGGVHPFFVEALISRTALNKMDLEIQQEEMKRSLIDWLQEQPVLVDFLPSIFGSKECKFEWGEEFEYICANCKKSIAEKDTVCPYCKSERDATEDDLEDEYKKLIDWGHEL